jgi:ABC-type Fe3+/spermidine/putrescine transport system ATPase subunit
MAGAGSLTLTDLTRRFGGSNAPAAVDHVTVSVAEGELLALVGASGSGKTTTLRIAAGYEPADEGRVELDGRDITRLPPQSRDFGMVFQHYALFPHLSVEDNVAFGLEARGVGRGERIARARGALAGVGLDGAGRRGIQSLSGGEQQRVAVARALVIEPRVLLLDEPLSNLDPTLRQAMRDELRAILRRQRVTALFVTHDQEDAFAIADRVALMDKGRVLQIGTPEMLYDAPATRTVADFIRGVPLVASAIEGSLRQLDPSLEEAAMGLGAGWWQTLRHVIYPAARPGLVAGATLAAITAVGEFVASEVLYTHANCPISVEILAQVRAFAFGTAAAYSVVLIGIVLVITLLARAAEDGRRGVMALRS